MTASTTQVKLYVDGTLRATSSGVGTKTNPTTNVYIGARTDGNGYKLPSGWIDDVQIYRGVLSAGQVAELYHGGSPYPAAVLADAPVAYWRLEETTGTNVAYDSTGNGNSFNYRTGANVSRTGTGADIGPRPPEFRDMPALNKAPTLTGDTSYLGDINGLLLGQNDYTAEMWFRPGTSTKVGTDGDYLLHRGTGSSNEGDYWGIGWSAAENRYTRLYFYDGNTWTTEGPWLDDGQWYHLAFVREGNDVRLYVDGREVASSEGWVPTADFSATSRWAFGGRLDSNSQRVAGNIDEIAIYGRALSAAEIRSHYVAAVPEPTSGLLLALGVLCLAVRRGSGRKVHL